MSQELRLKNVDDTRSYFLEGIEQNHLLNRMHKKVCTTLNYIETFLSSTITGCMSIYAFASLLGVLIGITKNICRIKYSTDNEGESVVAERFIRTLKNKI